MSKMLKDARRIYERSLVTVGATSGTECMVGLDRSGKPTTEMEVVVYEIQDNGENSTIHYITKFFESLGASRPRWTESQIAKFAYTDRFLSNYGNFFELKNGVVWVKRAGHIGFPSCRTYDHVWRKGNRHNLFSLR